MRMTERRLRNVIRQVLEEENNIFSRAGSALKRGIKSAVYGDYDLFLDDVIHESGVTTDGHNNYLVPMTLATSAITIDDDQIFHNESGSKYIIIYNDRKLLGLREVLTKERIPELFASQGIY
jgi:hypothetical protein